LKDACAIFNEMHKQVELLDVVTWSAMIAAFYIRIFLYCTLQNVVNCYPLDEILFPLVIVPS